MHALQTELATFNKNKEALLKSSENKYVLIKDDKILGVFETDNDALTYGYKKLGYVGLLVKQILKVDEPINLHIRIGL